MSYDAAYQRVRDLFDAMPSISTVTDGRQPFVDMDAPLAMLESAGSTGINPTNRKAQIINIWWRFQVRVAVPINDTTATSIAETETALRAVAQDIISTFAPLRGIQMSDLDAHNERESWVNVNGVIYRVLLVLIEILDQMEY